MWEDSSTVAIPFAKRLPLEKPHFLYDSVAGIVMAFHAGGGEVAVFNRETRRWSKIDTSKNVEAYYRVLPHFDPANGGLFMFGGYGQFTAKNHVQLYDFERKVWERLQVTGAAMEPRSNVITAWAFSNRSVGGGDKVFLAGGYGNASGRQEQGFKHYQDIWEFDQGTYGLEKLADFGNDVPEMEVHGLVSLSDSQVYLIGSKRAESGFQTQLYAVDLEGPALNAVGEPLAYEPSGLYADAEGRRLMVPVMKPAGSDSATLTLFSINVPPLPLPVEPLHAGSRAVPSPWPFLLILLASMAVGFGLWHSRNNHRKQATVKRQTSRRERRREESPLSVELFGAYRVVLNGTEITHRMWASQKARLLLLYLILRDSRGVATEQAIVDFWPEADHEHGMNSLNVAASRIRRALKEFDGDTVVRDDHLIRLSEAVTTSSDLYRFHQLLGDGASTEDLEEALKIYGKTGLAPEVEAQWIEPIREHTHREAQRTARRLSKAFDEEGDWKGLERLGRQVLSWDDLDDDGVRMVVKGLHQRRKVSLAHEEFRAFCHRFLKELGETYTLTYKELVS